MSYQALARKWRPRNFSELVGQIHVRTALENALSQGRLHPALLFSGTRGVGKTTLARIIARSLNCETGITATPCGQCSACLEIEQGRFVDLIEVDAASRTKVDDTRELLDNVPYAPARGRFKVYLIDEVHMLIKSSFNALLKTLEEPPGHVQFLFATTDPQKLPVTILSRCLQFHLQRITAEDIAERMRFILGEEGISTDDEGLRRLARAADGSLRDGLSLLDQAIAFGGGAVAGPAVAKMLGSIERRDLLRLVDAISRQDAAAAWAAIDAIDEQGLDFAEVMEELCRLWQRLAVGQRVPQVWDEVEQADLGPLVEHFSPEDLQVFYQIAVNARRDLDWAPDPRSGFEMVVLRTLAFLPESAASAPATSGSAPARRTAPPAQPSRAGGGQAPVQAARDESLAPPAQQEQDGGAPQEAPPPPQAAGVESSALTPGAIVWGELLPRLELSGICRMIAESCSIRSQNADELVLLLGPDVDQLCTSSLQARLIEALRAVIGTHVQVRLERPAAQDMPAPRTLNPEQAFLAEPGVQRAMDTFGAELMPGSLRVSIDDDGEHTTH